MKKGIFINIAVISNLSVFYLLEKIDIYYFSIIPAIACLVGTKRLSDLYVSYENKIKKKRKVHLYILIILNYLSLISLCLSTYYRLDTLRFYVANGLVTFYIVLLVWFIYTVTNIARDENKNAESKIDGK